MALPNLGTLSLRPSAVRATGTMYDSDDEEAAPAPAPAAPVAAAPSIVLTGRQKLAVFEYIRAGMYEQFFWYLQGDAYPGESGEWEELKAFNREFKRWQALDARRVEDYEYSEAKTIAQNTADEKIVKVANIVTDKAREAVIEFEGELYSEYEMRTVALRFDIVAENAVRLVENFMRHDDVGFLDEAAEKTAIQAMAHALRGILDPG